MNTMDDTLPGSKGASLGMWASGAIHPGGKVRPHLDKAVVRSVFLGLGFDKMSALEEAYGEYPL